MKRAVAAALCAGFIVFSAGAAPAENGTIPSIRETIQSEQESDFSFRNGIRWGMSPEEVRALENAEMTERTLGDLSVLVTVSPVKVSLYTADLVFMFYQNRLKMINYEFQYDGSMVRYQYLTGALCSVYGESRDPGTYLIKAQMDRIYPDRYTQDWIREAHAWAAQDGTAVYQYFFTTGAYAILYTCPELSGQNSEYDVSGL